MNHYRTLDKLDNAASDYRICRRCIMDTSDPEITFDEQGVCCHCRQYEERASKELYYHEDGQRRLEGIIKEIKEAGKDKEYDCLIGLSGGIDSSMTAYHVKRLGLRPLAIHFDNGWNSEISVCNVERLVRKLDIDLHTHVMDWLEFKDLHLAFLKASVIDSELPTDHGICAILFREAASRGIKYILSGSNIVTEAVYAKSWGYQHLDLRLIRGIHRRFGAMKLKTFPMLTFFDLAYYIFIKKIRFIPLLNYVPYNRQEAMQILQNEIGYKEYGGKHHESIYTRFFQSYILPKKFHIDKRRAHLSTLICSGQMTREEGLAEMEQPPMPALKLNEDREFVIKKLGLGEEEFEKIMAMPPKSFDDYPNNRFWLDKMSFLVQFAKKMTNYNA
jgi:N-acetyl sugar amidotransferase